MELAVYNIKGEDTGKKVTLNDAVFAVEEPNQHVIYLAVKQYLANQRQGTHKAKERSEVSGSTRSVFGPRPRDYRFKLNKKTKDLARRSALTLKAADNEILVVEDFTFEAPKTKEFVNIANNLKINGKKATWVLADQNKNVYLSARNIEGVKIATASDLNTYVILDNKVLVLSESAVPVVNEF